jgi:hypothetical protein
MKILKEPLLHFLLLGGLLFGCYALLNNPANEARSDEIVVDRQRLLTFMQNRAKAFAPDRFNQLLNEMPSEQLQTFIDDYVREEALYREALAMNLDKSDYVTRRRLIQKLEYIIGSFFSTGKSLTTTQLEAYYQENNAAYYQPAQITFTHVFFSSEHRGGAAARTLAAQTLQTLNEEQVPFHQALGYGERFLYHSNYVNKTADDVASHFGADLQRQLFGLKADEHTWRGPFTSPYGEHLIMLRQYKPGYQPALSAMQTRVSNDARHQHQEAELKKKVQAIINTYKVRVADDLSQQAVTENRE